MQRTPLAERMRPTKLNEVIGQPKLLGKGEILNRIIKNKQPVSLILWGPPGTGKTTIARILATEINAEFIELSAVTSGKKDVEKVIEHARQNWNMQIRTMLFVDEIHRFNKAQQDAFLPHVESGLITLIGATTENPSFEIISPLLSRTRVVVLSELTKDDIKKIITKALKAEKKTKIMPKDSIDYLAQLSGGDARKALSTLEIALSLGVNKITKDDLDAASGEKLARYDKNNDMHYDIVSAFIKSMRGSSVEASLYYLARMLDAGEDPKFIARRMIIFASEDIGMAGNGALGLAVNAFQAVERVGMPECKYTLFHTATALAKSNKSRAIVEAMNKAENQAKTYKNSPVPLHMRNAPTKLMKDIGYNKGYQWKANFQPEKGFLPEEMTTNEQKAKDER